MLAAAGTGGYVFISWLSPSFAYGADPQQRPVLLVLITIMPYIIGMSGLIYLSVAWVLNGIYLYYSVQMWRDPDNVELPMKSFKFSISYLGFLFAALLIDHYFLIQINV